MTDTSTRAAIEQSLTALVQQQGQWIARDPVRVRTLLQQTFAGSPVAQSPDLEAAVAAVELGVFDVLSRGGDTPAVDQLVASLGSARGLTPDQATWAIQAWARAAALPLPGVAPPPAPPSPPGTGTMIIQPPAGGQAASLAGGGVSPPQPQYPSQPPQTPTAPVGPGVGPPTQPQAGTYGSYTPAQGAPQAPPPVPGPPPGVPQAPPQTVPGSYPGQAPYGSGTPGGGWGGPPVQPFQPSPAPGGKGPQIALLAGVGVLALVLIAGAVIFVTSRSKDEPALPTATTASSTTKRSTTTTDQSDESSTTRSSKRSTTTTEESTTTTAPTTTTEAPLQWTTFNDPSGKYSVDFPGPYKLETSNDTVDGQAVGIFAYYSKVKGVEYAVIVEELPPGYYFPNPTATIDKLISKWTSADAGNIVNRDSTPFAGLPALFVHVKKSDSETNVLGVIAGNRVYILYAVGAPDLSQGDFPRFRSSFQLKA